MRIYPFRIISIDKCVIWSKVMSICNLVSISYSNDSLLLLNIAYSPLCRIINHMNKTNRCDLRKIVLSIWNLSPHLLVKWQSIIYCTLSAVGEIVKEKRKRKKGKGKKKKENVKKCGGKGGRREEGKEKENGNVPIYNYI